MSAEIVRGAAGIVELLVDPAVYHELHRIAGRQLRREPRGVALEPAALVHEAWLRLVGAPPDVSSRAHFFGLVARLMRQILVDHARRRGAARRDAACTVSLEACAPAATVPADATGLHDALDRLARDHPEQARVVELRGYGGFTIEETAQALRRSPATVKRAWCQAREWLRRELGAGGGQ